MQALLLRVSEPERQACGFEKAVDMAEDGTLRPWKCFELQELLLEHPEDEPTKRLSRRAQQMLDNQA